MKHPDLLTLFNALTLLDADITGGNLCHANCQDCHQADGRIVSFHENDSPCSSRGDIALSSTLSHPISPVRGTKILKEWLRIVRSVLHIRFDYSTAYGAIPAMVTQGAQESLVDCAADEIIGDFVVC